MNSTGTNAAARILIVDDEIPVQNLLRSIFDRSGFECAAAGGAAEALAQLRVQHFDVALIDLRLPDRPGTKLLQDMRSAYPDIPVIMITAVDSAETAIETIHMGAYDYLIKPLRLEQVLISINRALEKHQLENSNREYQKYLQQVAEERAGETRRLFYSMTRVLMRLLDFKVPYYAGHAMRVAEMARYLADAFHVTEDGIRKVYLAGLLHDVGMITVDNRILSKPAPLTVDEQNIIQEGSRLSVEILRPILEDEEVLKYIRHHREKFDGTGYPDGLKGNIIPLGARIIAVVEAFDAMTENRPYRRALTAEQGIAELVRCSESQFDSQVVSVFVELHKRSTLKLEPRL